jgi:hypothetical protein
MELITYLIGLMFGVKQEIPVVVEQQIVPIVATTTPVKSVSFTLTKKLNKVYTEIKPIVIPEQIVAITSQTQSTTTEPIIPTETFVVSQPIIEYNIDTTITPTNMEVTISEPEFTINPRANSSKYLGTFTVSDTSKKVTMIYNGTSTNGTTVKGGFEYQPNQPYNIYWEDIGEFNYTINYNNGEVVREGTFTVAE